MGDKGVPYAQTVTAQDVHPGYAMTTYSSVPPSVDVGAQSKAIVAGTDFHQMLQIKLAPGDIITAEPGTMVMMEDGLQPYVDMGGCSQACKRSCCAGENFFRLVFENKSQMDKFVALAPQGPGKVIPLPLAEWSGVRLSAGVFLAAYGKDWIYELDTVGNCLTCCCGGQGLFLPKLTGNGIAFISASGSVEVIDLQEGQKLVIDQPNLVAFSKTVGFDVRTAGSCLTCCCGGMGLFNVVLTGPGKVIVESLPMKKLAAALLKAGVQANGGGGGGAN